MVKFSASKWNMYVVLVKELSNAIMKSGIIVGCPPFFNSGFREFRNIVGKHIFHYAVKNRIIILLIDVYIVIGAILRCKRKEVDFPITSGNLTN